ncbi:TonB-linked outer membrane protein, SusC/RagA family [Mucilaginibacter sp. OK268]|uniref:TonB-dependent receptor n=1 Tax=Mucilaginibacter sp. OK268 TaxID=1881048 RepID=UPI00088ED1E6|nr:TonB-dependent receptor [Mucilaginibacter sp. OK268]SDP76460.1 TonB-linked outer membrane protein, SusC/RagA family [Mucilaginibacter sp. OK268]
MKFINKVLLPAQPQLAKTILAMKLIAIMMFTALTQVSASSFSQTITLRENKISIEKVLQLIEKQSGYYFLYNSKDIPQNERISVTVTNASIEEVLKQCFKDQPLSYKIIRQTIVLKRKYVEENQAPLITPAIKISGTVTDEKGALPGVSVKLKGSTIGTVTDVKGNYSLTFSDSNGTLVFTSIGYVTQEIAINGQTKIDVQLKAESKGLNEVVVVGYGTQKKVNLTGAVSSVSGDDLKIRPVGQTSASLQGVAPGVTVTQSSGRPGGDAGTIRIRGVGTIETTGKTADPLVLIDGIEGSMNNIDPNLIESVSILKDAASASIYGSRAANGVILVTTKRGGKQIGISYNSYAGWQKPTNMPKTVNALDHMLLLNEAYVNVGRTQLYSDALIQQYRAQNGVSTDQYPNTDWQKEVLIGSGFQQSQFLTVNGGSEKVRLLTSVGYFNQKGIIENSDFKRYTIRNNTDVTFSKKFSAKFDLQIINAVTKEPGVGSGNIFNYINGIPANQLGVNSNGSWGVGWNGLNPIAQTKDGGTNKTTAPFATLNATLLYSPVEWLKAEVNIGPKYAESIGKNFNKAIQTYLPDGTPSFKTPALTTLTESSSRSFYNTLRAMLTFNKTFGAHDLKAIVGASQEDYHNDYTSAYRDTYILPDYPVINAGSTANQQTAGTSEAWALRSYFGRINYDYKQKYLMEVNGRYDGSSRFAKGNKYAFFPSVSAGWRISQESFMEPLKNTIDELKLRLSWGRLGNQNIGTYPSVTAVVLGTSVFGKQVVNTASLNSLANSDITWESTKMSDIGIDMTLFSHLTITADYYTRKTSNILLLLDIPLIIGLNAPFQNAGVVKNKGWELGIGYKGNINAFKYSVNLNLSDVQNKVIDMHGISLPGLTVNREGYAVNSIYGYQAEGYFKDAADVAGHATQFGTVAAGDIKYKDQNNDGIINEKDKVVLGSTIPRYTYASNITGSFKGFDISIFLQGVGKANGYLYGPGIMPFSTGQFGGTILEQNKDRWTPDNPNAKFPRLAFGGSNNEQNSSFWMKDASYLRLKNLQVGYTFPVSLTSKIGVRSMRMFVNGSNLFTSDNFWKGYDVESPVGTVNSYPQVKVYSFGLNVNF